MKKAKIKMKTLSKLGKTLLLCLPGLVVWLAASPALADLQQNTIQYYPDSEVHGYGPCTRDDNVPRGRPYPEIPGDWGPGNQAPDSDNGVNQACYCETYTCRQIAAVYKGHINRCRPADFDLKPYPVFFGKELNFSSADLEKSGQKAPSCEIKELKLTWDDDTTLCKNLKELPSPVELEALRQECLTRNNYGYPRVAANKLLFCKIPDQDTDTGFSLSEPRRLNPDDISCDKVSVNHVAKGTYRFSFYRGFWASLSRTGAIEFVITVPKNTKLSYIRRELADKVLNALTEGNMILQIPGFKKEKYADELTYVEKNNTLDIMASCLKEAADYGSDWEDCFSKEVPNARVEITND